MKWYKSGQFPEKLYNRTQLRKLKLKPSPNQKPAGYWHRQGCFTVTCMRFFVSDKPGTKYFLASLIADRILLYFHLYLLKEILCLIV
jgi:hypothetical protein